MRFISLFFLTLLVSCTSQPETPKTKVSPQDLAQAQKALFAGGCFWCMEPPFDKMDGVLSTTSGFAGGTEVNPSYKDVASGKTGHIESVLIHFDPKKVTFAQLLKTYWKQINPTDSGGQFVDRGPHYRPVVFYYDDKQKTEAEKSKKELSQSGKFKKPITVEILKATEFYSAEDYHQDYYQKNPLRYKYYRRGSGRDQYLEKIWGAKK